MLPIKTPIPTRNHRRPTPWSVRTFSAECCWEIAQHVCQLHDLVTINLMLELRCTTMAITKPINPGVMSQREGEESISPFAECRSSVRITGCGCLFSPLRRAFSTCSCKRGSVDEAPLTPGAAPFERRGVLAGMLFHFAMHVLVAMRATFSATSCMPAACRCYTACITCSKCWTDLLHRRVLGAFRPRVRSSCADRASKIVSRPLATQGTGVFKADLFHERRKARLVPVLGNQTTKPLGTAELVGFMAGLNVCWLPLLSAGIPSFRPSSQAPA